MFNGVVPGNDDVRDSLVALVQAVEAGASAKDLANYLATTPYFSSGPFSAYSPLQTNTDFAQAAVNKLVASNAPASAKQFAYDFALSALNGGATKAEVLLMAVEALLATDEADFASSKAALIDQADKVIKYALTPTDDHELKIGVDTIYGTGGDDTFTAPLAQNKVGQVVNTLESGDSVDGGAGHDTLNAVITSSQSASMLVAPAISATIKNVEVLTFQSQFNNTDTGLYSTVSNFSDYNPTVPVPNQGYAVAGAIQGNHSHIDAQNHSGVQEYWDLNSRADLQIEDIRQLPEELLFGMRQTDPFASYLVYFDPAQVNGDRGTRSNSKLTLTMRDNVNPSSEMANLQVDGVGFKLNGVIHDVRSTAVGNAKTYAEFASALQAALTAAGLTTINVTFNVASNSVTLTDSAGGTFESRGLSWVDNLTPPVGNIMWDVSPGDPVLGHLPVTTKVVLDAVGRTSQGGTLDIGSMGQGGVEKFDVQVDRDSWLTFMTSREFMGHSNTSVQFYDPENYLYGATNDHLETVTLTSIGSKGNLSIGSLIEERLDGRMVNGLQDVREVLNTGFTGKLNYGVVLTDESEEHYLAHAAGPVMFTYEGGAKDDNITIRDASTAGIVSGDPDFNMTVSMGAGDDRLNIKVPTVRNVSVDGGTGKNVIAVAESHGTKTADTFKSFKNFQTYEDEGTTNNTHNFTSMLGVTQVNVATEGGVNTTIQHLAADAAVTITGKNQTRYVETGNKSNTDQKFGKVDIQSALVTDTDKTVRVTLENTARIGVVAGVANQGVLAVDQLSVSNFSATDLSQIRTLELVSAATSLRQQVNEVGTITAPQVDNFILSGTQALHIRIDSAANSDDPITSNRRDMTVDGSELKGDLGLVIDAGLASAVDAATNVTVGDLFLVGTTRTNDVLTFNGTRFHLDSKGNKVIDPSAVLKLTADTHVSGFETVRFNDTKGTVDVINFSGVTKAYRLGDVRTDGIAATDTDPSLRYDNAYGKITGDFTMTHLQGDASIVIDQVALNAGVVGGVPAPTQLAFIAAGQSTASVLHLNLLDAENAPGTLFIQDFRTVDVTLSDNVHTAGADDDAYVLDFNFADRFGVDKDGKNVERVDVATGYKPKDVFTNTLVLHGGGDTGQPGYEAAVATKGVDSVDLGVLTNVLHTIDLSDYKGLTKFEIDSYDETFNGDNGTIENVIIKMNGYGSLIEEKNIGGADKNHVTYVFTQDLVARDANYGSPTLMQPDYNDVQITGFRPMGTVAVPVGGSTVGNVSVLDFRPLAALGFHQGNMHMESVFGHTLITADVSLGLNLEIWLVGIDPASLTIGDNFIFG
jgi:hypothetical protein